MLIDRLHNIDTRYMAVSILGIWLLFYPSFSPYLGNDLQKAQIFFQ